MIKDLLEKNNLLLRMSSTLEGGKILIKLLIKKEKPGLKNILAAIPENSPKNIRAYYLPWKYDTGYYIDLPAQNPDRKIFITAELSGCCVGVQKLNDSTIRIRHYNIMDRKFSNDDLQRYGKTSWLLPEKYRTEQNENDYKFYNRYINGTDPTCFWGEFTDKWNFYYQTPDSVIHDFEY